MSAVLDWVKKLGQWHLSGGNGQTRCGVPMLGNNYAKYIPENEAGLAPRIPSQTYGPRPAGREPSPVGASYRAANRPQLVEII